MIAEDEKIAPWKKLRQGIEAGDIESVEVLLEQWSGSEKALAVSRLDDDLNARLLTLVSAETAAELMEDLSDEQAADLIDDIPAHSAAAIVDEMDSDDQADVLSRLEQDEAEAILEKMDPEEAEDARRLLQYSADSAGGMMITEHLAYIDTLTVDDVFADLRHNREKYADYEVTYLYTTDKQGRLRSVLRMRHLMLAPRSATLATLATRQPTTLMVDADLDTMRREFDRNEYIGLPVIDHDDTLLGVVRRQHVLEAVDEEDNRAFLNFSGIVGGEELRSMPTALRSRRRLGWLCINVFLNILGASVIAFYQDTLAGAIVLAVFLPVISDMSGCSGNQAVAVSIRELSLGQVMPNELFRVLTKEASVGVINGTVLGLLIGCIAYFWQGSAMLGVVVGAALALNSLVAVCLGGVIPLLLQRCKLDPALASSPLLTTITDMLGFFFVLSFATVALV